MSHVVVANDKFPSATYTLLVEDLLPRSGATSLDNLRLQRGDDLAACQVRAFSKKLANLGDRKFEGTAAKLCFEPRKTSVDQ